MVEPFTFPYSGDIDVKMPKFPSFNTCIPRGIVNNFGLFPPSALKSNFIKLNYSGISTAAAGSAVAISFRILL